jgi:sugar lactone lactonase YvrE
LAGSGGDQVDNLSLSSDGDTLSISGYLYTGTGPGAKKGTSSVRLRPTTAVLRASSVGTTFDGKGIVTRTIGAAALSPDGRTLYVCTPQGRVAVLAAYDVATSARRRTLATWAGGCSFALDSAGRYALIATAGGSLSRLDIGTGKLTTLPVSGLPSSAILAW